MQELNDKSYAKVESLVDEAIRRLSADDSVTNLKMMCRKNYDKWVLELFPLLKDKNKSTYEVLSKILVSSGYANATPELLRGYLSDIARERVAALQIDNLLVTHEPAVTAITSPVVVSMPVAVKPAVEAPEPAYAVAPIEIDTIFAEQKRLRAEKKEGFGEWNGRDEWLWQKEIWDSLTVADRSMVYAVKEAIGDPEMIAIYDLLCEKRVKLGLPCY